MIFPPFKPEATRLVFTPHCKGTLLVCWCRTRRCRDPAARRPPAQLRRDPVTVSGSNRCFVSQASAQRASAVFLVISNTRNESEEKSRIKPNGKGGYICRCTRGTSHVHHQWPSSNSESNESLCLAQNGTYIDHMRYVFQPKRKLEKTTKEKIALFSNC